jgi:hypothetical protein
LKASGLTEVQNTKALAEQIEELQAQAEKLLESRKAFSTGQLGNAEAQRALAAEMHQLRELEGVRRQIDEQQDVLAHEAGRLVDVERSLKADIERINKVIYTHGQLNLFNRDTCPYCLNDVMRSPGHCVCGHSVEELDYQRFFYSPVEYLEILRSKTKTLETLRFAIKELQDEAAQYKFEREQVLETLATKRNRIEDMATHPSLVEHAMEELDDKLLSTRERLAKAEEAFRLESKLATLAGRVDDKKRALDLAKSEVVKLDLASKQELQQQIEKFNDRYDDFMTTVVSDCRNAAIDPETYLPLINNGEYREASAKVPKRFLYFLTLLQLSLLSDVPFPRLLLIDTPETAGIDFEPLVKMLRQIGELENVNNLDFQVILSTGEKKYPPEYESNVLLRLSKEDRLLQARIPQS